MIVTVIELLINRIWYRTLAIIWRVCSWGLSTKTSTTHSSPSTRLPLEIVQMIIAYLIYDTPSLRACTMTCYSWHIAAAPHLHHTYTVGLSFQDQMDWWPYPFACMDILGLSPLVKKLRINGHCDYSIGVFPDFFIWSLLPHLSHFTSIQELEIEFLAMPWFMLNRGSSVKHFLPTLRSLTLREPKGSSRRIIYFIGHFQHLQDLKLIYDRDTLQGEMAGDPTFVPPFVPPLRGSLTVAHLTSVDLLKDMIELFGGFRFRSMNLLDVYGMELLLDACAETLESVVLHPTDPRGESLFLKVTEVITNDLGVGYTLRDFDLSRNKSLRILEVPASSLNHTSRADTFLKHVLSTITSSAFFQITVLYEDRNFWGGKSRWSDRPPFRMLSRTEREAEVSLHHKRFEVLRNARGIRDFQLVLCASVWGYMGERLVRTLEEAVAEEKAKNGFDGFSSDPSVTYYPRRSRDDQC